MIAELPYEEGLHYIKIVSGIGIAFSALSLIMDSFTLFGLPITFYFLAFFAVVFALSNLSHY